MGFRLVFFANVRFWNKQGRAVRSFLALFRGSFGRWVVARGRGEISKKWYRGQLLASSPKIKILLITIDIAHKV